MTRRALALALLTALVAAGLAVAPATAAGPPRTLADQAALGDVRGPSRTVEPGHPVDYLGLSWRGAAELSVRFSVDGTWSEWTEVEDDGAPSRGRSFGDLVDGRDADAYQVSGRGADVRAVAINTTDGPRASVDRGAVAHAGVVQPGLVSRAGWGADESLRFRSDGSEVWPPAFAPTQKLVVHHTATRNGDDDPAATVRAIYRYHAVDKGWGDIGYNFLVDAQGLIYKGRWSGEAGTTDPGKDTLTGENADGHGVTAAHVGGYNSGTAGIAVLGDYDKATKPSSASVQAVVDHLAWEAQRHGLDPEASSVYVNPVNGSTKDVANISGHRDWASTACPGRHLYALLPDIRADVAAALAAAEPDTTAPATPTGLTATAGDARVDLDWDDAAEAGVTYRVDLGDASGGWSALATTSTSGYAHTGLENGTNYTYQVVALDGSGNASEPAGPVSATPTASTTTTEVVTATEVSVQKGTATSTTSAGLDADGGSTYDVATARQGRTHVTAWTARFAVGAISALTVDLDGRSSASATRTLEAWDVVAGAWREVGSATVGTTDVATTWTTSAPAPYLDSQGRVLVRVTTSGASSATTATDLLTATVSRSG